MQGILSLLRRIPWQALGWGLLLGLLQSAFILVPTLLGQNTGPWLVVVSGLLFLAIPGVSVLLASRRKEKRPQASGAGCWTAVVALVLLLPLPWIIANITYEAQLHLCNERLGPYAGPAYGPPYGCYTTSVAAVLAPWFLYGLFVLYSVAGCLLAALGGWMGGRLGTRTASSEGR